MSIKVMQMVWETNGKELGGSARMLMLAIADNANDDGYAWPGIAHLSQKTGISERQVMRLVKQCETAGLLHVKRSANKVNKYYIQLDALRAISGDIAVSPEPSRDNLSRDKLSRDTHVTLEVTPVSPEPSYNHQLNTHARDDTAELVAALAGVVLNRFWERTEAQFNEAATWLLSQGATPEGVRSFAQWFEEYDDAAPWLANYRNEWSAFTSGKPPSFAGKRRTSSSKPDKHEQLAALMKYLRRGTTDYTTRTKPELQQSGLWPVVDKMGRWSDLCRWDTKTIEIRFYQAYNEVMA